MLVILSCFPSLEWERTKERGRPRERSYDATKTAGDGPARCEPAPQSQSTGPALRLVTHDAPSAHNRTGLRILAARPAALRQYSFTTHSCRPADQAPNRHRQTCSISTTPRRLRAGGRLEQASSVPDGTPGRPKTAEDRPPRLVERVTLGQVQDRSKQGSWLARVGGLESADA
jgi:hypothetical protein